MSGFKFDPSQPGLRKTLKEYEELALRYIWEADEAGANSGETWRNVNKRLKEGQTISRTSIIFHLNRMVDQGVLAYREATGKGWIIYIMIKFTLYLVCIHKGFITVISPLYKTRRRIRANSTEDSDLLCSLLIDVNQR